MPSRVDKNDEQLVIGTRRANGDKKMPIDNMLGIKDENEMPTPAWDDIVQNSLKSGQTEIYDEACLLWDFYYKIYNGGIESWISNMHFFRVHDVRRVLRNIGGTATLEIKELLLELLPFLNFGFDPLMPQDNPMFYHRRTILDGPEWEIIKQRIDDRLSVLKQEFRREGEEYFAAHWHRFGVRGI
jgi:hypothetical protein